MRANVALRASSSGPTIHKSMSEPGRPPAQRRRLHGVDDAAAGHDDVTAEYARPEHGAGPVVGKSSHSAFKEIHVVDKARHDSLWPTVVVVIVAPRTSAP